MTEDYHMREGGVGSSLCLPGWWSGSRGTASPSSLEVWSTTCNWHRGHTGERPSVSILPWAIKQFSSFAFPPSKESFPLSLFWAELNLPKTSSCRGIREDTSSESSFLYQEPLVWSLDIDAGPGDGYFYTYSNRSRKGYAVGTDWHLPSLSLFPFFIKRVETLRKMQCIPSTQSWKFNFLAFQKGLKRCIF